MTFAVGSLVAARGREWVVLPGSDPELLLVRPVGGTDDETTGLLPAVEPVAPARFDWPAIDQPGNHLSAQLLRDALRLGFRSSAGPFRSFGSIAVEPRPYQLVPLLMALRQNPVRLLIADAAGIGKTVEAGLIAVELLATGAAQRLAVICGPQLAEQWQRELADKFHVHAELVLPSTAPRLERPCAAGQSLFDLYPHVIVSTDFIKTDRRRAEFIRTCPDFVIVDEAHNCAADQDRRSGRHYRYELISGLAADPERHLVLVTGTPDSGHQGAFQSLVGLLGPDLSRAVEDLGVEANRRLLAAHFVQRTRADIEHFLDDTPFPRRLDAEAHYNLTPEYRALFERAVSWARQSVHDITGGQRRQRVRWWSAIALLRALASSPAAAAATLRNRSGLAEAETPEEIDALARRELLDQTDDGEESDLVVGVLADDAPEAEHRQLLELAREAERLAHAHDAKLEKAKLLVGELLTDGFNSIIFCEYIETAEYVAAALRDEYGDRAGVVAVTGRHPVAEREARIEELCSAPRRILVATDCMSEGLNLQEHFDAVLHYDLAWTPTKHEQREARVSRFGQRSDEVRVITYFGRDNPIDGIVLDVLLRKHEQIRKRTGVAVAVPSSSGAVMEAILEGLLLRGRNHDPGQLSLFDAPDPADARRDELHSLWEDAAARERRSRSLYAQHAIKVDEVREQLEAARAAIGGPADVAQLVRNAVLLHGGTCIEQNGTVNIDMSNAPTALRDALPALAVRGRFDTRLREDEEHLIRSHPFVEALATYVLQAALDDELDGVAARTAVTRSTDVERRTTLLLVRYRFDVTTIRRGVEHPLLAEDADILAFEGPPDQPAWLETDRISALLSAPPADRVPAEQARTFLQRVLDARETLDATLAERARARAKVLLETHRRVRSEAGARHVTYRVTPHLPVDVLGIYVLLPGGDSQ